jgi:serine protease
MHMRSLLILAAGLMLGGPAKAEEIVPGRVIVRWRDPAAAARKMVAAHAWSVGRRIDGEHHILTTSPTVSATNQLLAELRRDPDVAWAEPDRVRRRLADEVVPNDPRYDEQWALPMIKAPAAWARSTGSDRVTVAIVDTGLVPHPELTPREIGRAHV